MKDLTNRVAIVTGSSSGVGAATARLLAAQGCHVVINYNSNAEGAEQVAADCEAAGAETWFASQRGHDEDCVAMAQAAQREMGSG